MVGQADMMQARWGSHGDFEIIAVSPQSPQEAFDLTIDAFNLSETYRTPVLVMMDECVGHMTERVVIPEPDAIDIVPRAVTERSPEDYLPYRLDERGIPEFAPAGAGYRFHTTGLTHDERGYPVMTAEAQEWCVGHLIDKIRSNVDEITMVEEEGVEGAEVIVMTYGITARVARMGIEMARSRGIDVGAVRLVVVWPFPERRVRELAADVAGIVVPEINYGQMVREVERTVSGACRVLGVPHAGGGVHDPTAIADAIQEVAA
jgi:2-oxoglutarate ferredoxin oxidoreductase subunit alpha